MSKIRELISNLMRIIFNFKVIMLYITFSCHRMHLLFWMNIIWIIGISKKIKSIGITNMIILFSTYDIPHSYDYVKHIDFPK